MFIQFCLQKAAATNIHEGNSVHSAIAVPEGYSK